MFSPKFKIIYGSWYYVVQSSHADIKLIRAVTMTKPSPPPPPPGMSPLDWLMTDNVSQNLNRSGRGRKFCFWTRI